MTTYILVAICFLLGIFLQRYAWGNPVLTPLLNNCAIYVALPAIILVKVPQLTFSSETLFAVISAWGAMALSALVILPLGRRLCWQRDVIIAVIMLAGLGNTAFLGMSLIKLLSPDGVLPFAIIFDQLGSFLILSLACPLAISFSHHSNEFPSALSIAKRVLFFPPFACLVIALLVPLSWLTQALETPLEWLGLLLLPIAMLVVGLQFRLRIETDHKIPTAAALGIKLILVPVLVSLAGISLSIPADIFQASVLQSAMPAMVTPAIFLISSSIAPRLSATILSFGTLVSFVTIPTIAFLLN